MKEKVVVITGASRGIGRSISIEFAKGNFFLALCSRNKKSVSSLKKEIEKISSNFLVFSFDIRIESKIIEFVNEVVNKKKQIDVLINNAGVVHTSRVEDMNVNLWDEIIDINLRGTFLMTKYCLPFMEQGGHIVSIGSNASKIGFPSWSAYCASKFGMLGFTKSLREEVRNRGIKVSAVLPGPTKTEIWDHLDVSLDENNMMDAETVAKTVFSVVCQPSGANIDEVDIIPFISNKSNG